MNTNISQIFSNFKFSENGIQTSSSSSISSKYTLVYQGIIGIAVITIFALVYFKRDELISLLSGVFSDLLTTTWLNTHLTSTGELATTYVPSNFSGVQSDV